MKLHVVVGSPNCRKVQAVVNHLGLARDIEIEYLDFFAGEQRSPHFLRLNPNAMVPVLSDGDFALSESNAIMQYLAERAGDESLLPRDPRLRADVLRWQCWELAHYNKAFGTLSFEAIAKPDFLGVEPDAMKLAWAQQDLVRFAAVLDGHMAARRHAVGDSITLADYSLVHLEQFKEALPFDWSPFPNLNAYYERMRAVPHWRETAPPSREAIGRRPAAQRDTVAA
jgi:glutathione S-transferase